eukprot:scaffold318_cov396-Prasinococcus_capsulatus_cf.AAC.23
MPTALYNHTQKLPGSWNQGQLGWNPRITGAELRASKRLVPRGVGALRAESEELLRMHFVNALRTSWYPSSFPNAKVSDWAQREGLSAGQVRPDARLG